MIGLLTAIHVLLAVILILIVLVQNAKGTDVGSAFGGMGSQAAFGPRGTATFLSKATVGLAAAFMVTSVSLSILANRGGAGSTSVLSEEETAPAAAAPAAGTPVPGATAPGPAGAPGVQVETQGLGNLKATVTVENPGEAPDPNTPAARIETGGAPGAAAPNQPAPPSAAPAGP
ncbi:MAG TPA: preprotein translocase subunit SecG [Terriglobia bacterium]|nr:preprotein translocase subunit SecG [Terriglobia bacterium]